MGGEAFGLKVINPVPFDSRTKMQKYSTSRRVFIGYSLFTAIGAAFVLGGMFASPSEPGNTIFIGLSLPRLILGLGLLTAFLFFAGLTIKAARNSEWADQTLETWFGWTRIGRVTAWLAGIGLGLGWVGCFLPAYRVGALVNYWIRVRPAMAFILLASTAALIVIVIKRSKLTLRDVKISNAYYLTMVLFIACLLVLVVMLQSGFGVRTFDDYWYGAGIPLLASQLLAAILGGILFLQIEGKWNPRYRDLIVFLSIFAVTAILWFREPLQGSFIFVGPYPPNRALYPFADSATFDTASQFALIGEGISNGQFFERPLYLSFLVYLHSLAGQDYETLMAAQAGIFAVFPALVYLIGRSLNMRVVGFAAAIVAMLRGINSIAASNMIDMANPKMILTDFPTAIGIALIVLCTCEWLKRPASNQHNALWVGGAIGFTLMLRTNALVFLLFIPLYVAFRFWPEWKNWATGSVLIVLAMFAITLPWELRNQARGGQMYGPIVAKFLNVIQQRYLPTPEPGSLLPQDLGLASVSLKHTQALSVLYQSTKTASDIPSCDAVLCFVPNHFLHNLLTSILILPTSPVFEDLRHTVKEGNPYWQANWDGAFTGSALFFLALNIFFIVLGTNVAWRQQRLHGLCPLAIFIFYNISNALARTSGGRYLVPMDWIITIYFLLGLFQVITWSARIVAPAAQWKLFPIPGATVIPRQGITARGLPTELVIPLILLGFGSLLPLSENLYAARYQNFDFAKALTEHEQALASAGMEISDINSFLANPNAELLVGRVLYPRYYPMGRGEIHFYPFITMEFPRVTFILIGPKGEQGIILPGDSPKYFPQGADAIVLGCNEHFYIDALAVILLDEKSAAYTRSPKSELQCPLKQPVCDDNRVCQ